MTIIRVVCSNKPKPRVQRGAKGHAGWGRDVYHALKSGATTYCGSDASEWLVIDDNMALNKARADGNFCIRCLQKMTKIISTEARIFELENLLREFIDIEGPCPGTSTWAEKVRCTLSNGRKG